MDPFIVRKKGVKKLTGHDDQVCYAVYFPVHKRIASCSFDRSVRVWDAETGSLLKTFNVHRDWVSCLLKWNDSDFISCSDDGTCCTFSVDTLHKHDRIIDPGGQLIRMIRIDETTFAALTFGNSGIILISYTTGETLKTITGHYADSATKIILSLKDKSIYYANFRDTGLQRVAMKCGFEHSKDIDRYQTGDESTVDGMTIYLNKTEDEILVVGGRGEFVNFFNTEVFPNPGPFRTISCIKKPIKGLWISSVFILNSRYLLAGDNEGFIRLIDIHNECPKAERKCHTKNPIQEISLIKKKRRKREVCVITCSGDGTMDIIKICNIEFPSSLEESDVLERVSFLRTEYIEVDEDIALFKLVTSNCNILFFKCLLY